jgi:hypothetical protein
MAHRLAFPVISTMLLSALDIEQTVFEELVRIVYHFISIIASAEAAWDCNSW